MVSALLPRPLALAGGVCLTGLQILKEVSNGLIPELGFGSGWSGSAPEQIEDADPEWPATYVPFFRSWGFLYESSCHCNCWRSGSAWNHIIWHIWIGLNSLGSGLGFFFSFVRDNGSKFLENLRYQFKIRQDVNLYIGINFSSLLLYIITALMPSFSGVTICVWKNWPLNTWNELEVTSKWKAVQYLHQKLPLAAAFHCLPRKIWGRKSKLSTLF